MNYAESFQEFASKLGPTDLALYAGVALIIYVLFQDKFTPVQKILGNLLNQFNVWKNKTGQTVGSVVTKVKSNDHSFENLVTSWKQTRDLAVQAGCAEAVKVIDQVFPHLSPNSCKEEVKIS